MRGRDEQRDGHPRWARVTNNAPFIWSVADLSRGGFEQAGIREVKLPSNTRTT